MRPGIPSRRAPWILAAVIATGCSPVETAVFVASGATDHVFTLDGRTGEVVDTLNLDLRRFDVDEPHGLATAPDGGHLYVSVAHGDPTLWKYELPARRLVGRVALGIPGAGRIGITPDSREAFIPDYYRDRPAEDGQVAVVRLYDLVVEERLTVCPAPHDAVVAPDGAQVAITCTASDEIVILETESRRERRRFPVGPSPGPRGAPAYRPLNAVWSSDGGTVFVTLNLAGAIAAFGANGEPRGLVETGPGPAQLAISPDGRYLAVAVRGAGTLAVIDARTLTLERAVPVAGRSPHGVTIDAARPVAYLTHEGATDRPGGVSGIDLVTGEVLWTTEAGAYVLGVTSLTRQGALSR